VAILKDEGSAINVAAVLDGLNRSSMIAEDSDRNALHDVSNSQSVSKKQLLSLHRVTVDAVGLHAQLHGPVDNDMLSYTSSSTGMARTYIM